MTPANENRRLAVLIDGDNAEPKLIEHIMNGAAQRGTVTIKRIYADWTSPRMKRWIQQLDAYAIRPVQKFCYAKEKNSTDIAMIIDAMDILHAKVVDGFCIVSSDSDFTGLAHRIREEGLFVMGIGKATTPTAFVKACESFVETETFGRAGREAAKAAEEKPAAVSKPRRRRTVTPKAEAPAEKQKAADLPTLLHRNTGKPFDRRLLDQAYDRVVNRQTGVAFAARLGAVLRELDPEFNVKHYGCSLLQKFIEALGPPYEWTTGDKGQPAVRRSA